MSVAEAPPAVPRKRILALDGGGVRGVFAIEVLARIETLLREHFGRPEMVLADHFQMVAGTSTGAIIATLLSWGTPVETVRQLYLERCHEIFPKAHPWKFWHLPRLARALYGSEKLATFLREFFHDPETNAPARLGAKQLKNTLLVCMRNATTGSAWPITNNPAATYNRPERGADSNLNIPLWQLVRASTAAPVYFLPEVIETGKKTFAFVDGGLSPYNNPSLIAFLMATLPCYHLEWPTGTDRLRLVSIGTGRSRQVLRDFSFRALNIGTSLLSAPSGLMEGISLQQDFLCRVFGQCLFGDEIDREVGQLVPAEVLPPETRKFSYVRYDHKFTPEETAAATATYGGGLKLNNVRMMPFLLELGADYARKNVRLEHVL